MVQLILDKKADLGEGSIWHPEEKVLYWVDINKPSVYRYDPATGREREYPATAKCSTLAPCRQGGLLVAQQNGIHHLETGTGMFKRLTDPLTDPDIRYNDGKCDPGGRFWVGTIDMHGRPERAALYRFDQDGSLHEMLRPVTNSNGIVWTADKRTMYYIDTPTHHVFAFDYDNATGNISNRRIAVTVPNEMGSPDGMTIDASGSLWVALWGGGAVTCWDPVKGKLLQKITVPAPNISSCAFGGEKFDTLYITSAREHMTPQQIAEHPQSGSLFAVKPGVIGVPALFYEGAV